MSFIKKAVDGKDAVLQLSASQIVEKRYREVLKKQGLSEGEIEKTLVIKRERRTSKTLSEISENSKIRFVSFFFLSGFRKNGFFLQ